MCLTCGHAGAELQPTHRASQLVYECHCCGADLYARPPRSYAEMEGIEPAAARSRTRPRGDALATRSECGSACVTPARSRLWRVFEFALAALLCVAAAAVLTGSAM